MLFRSTYSPATHGLFATTIMETYRDSLDCPGLNGLRDIEDVITGHKSSGEFDPNLWFLLCEHGHNGNADGGDPGPTPVGVLLLSRVSRMETVELVYLGLVPAARGRGLGELLLKHALALVPAAGRSRLTLAVDAINAPAMRLYYRHGLQRVGARTAMMRELRPRGQAGVATATASSP